MSLSQPGLHSKYPLLSVEINIEDLPKAKIDVSLDPALQLPNDLPEALQVSTPNICGALVMVRKF